MAVVASVTPLVCPSAAVGSSTTGAVPVPPRGHLKSVAVFCASGTGQGPLSVTVAVQSFGNVMAVLAVGTVRGPAGQNTADPVYWTGDYPLGADQQNLLVSWANQSGATVNLIVVSTSEV